MPSAGRAQVLPMAGWAGGIELVAGDAGSSVGKGVVVGKLGVAVGGGEVVATD